jgi:hypothetical protein
MIWQVCEELATLTLVCSHWGSADEKLLIAPLHFLTEHKKMLLQWSYFGWGRIWLQVMVSKASFPEPKTPAHLVGRGGEG